MTVGKMVTVLVAAAAIIPVVAAIASAADADVFVPGSEMVGYLHTDGANIVDATGKVVRLVGVSWFGFETPTFAPHGLDLRSISFYLDKIKEMGFNFIRLPFSSEMFEPLSIPAWGDFNPELRGITPLELMDKIIAACRERGLRVLLDRHRPDASAQSALWYTPDYSEERWIEDWKMLVRRYKGDPTVFGVDLHNEPHDPATWGSGDPATDWRLAAERAGNAILSVNPDLLIVVEGINVYRGNWYWWGGNLMGVRDYPVELNVKNRLVYSPHDYGPGVYPQPWFKDPEFPHNLPALWDKYWSFIFKERRTPILIGEFGGRESDLTSAEGIWQNALVDYIKTNQLSFSYWSLNPDSGDTGGLLLPDWKTVEQDKLDMLRRAITGKGNNLVLSEAEVSGAPKR